MVEIEIEKSRLVVTVKGVHKLLAFKHRLAFPLDRVRRVTTDVDASFPSRKGLRAPGTHVPWVVTAGTYYRDGKRTFWDVRNPDRVIRIDLADESYDALIVEVADPADAVRRIEEARGRTGSERGV